MNIFNFKRILVFVGTYIFSTTLPLIGQNIIQNTDAGNVMTFDFPGMKIGVAENEEGPTGTTVFYFPDGVMGAADIRGGATGTVNASALSRGYERKMMDAVVFSGGSWYGLSAATGVANAIKDVRAEEGDVDFIAGVLGGIIYDVGGRRFSRVTPDDELGRKAFLEAKPNWFPLGARGAGRFAMQGSYFYGKEKGSVDGYSRWPHSGQGAAFGEIGETKIAVFTVVNALGTIVDRDGKVVRCHRNILIEDRPSAADLMKDLPAVQKLSAADATGPTDNTTLTLVVTNQKLPFWALQRLATQVHTSMGRAIQPFSTQFDGDVLYAVSTNEVENSALSPIDLAVAASELAWDAVLNSVPILPEVPRLINSKPELGSLIKYKGQYQFYGGGILSVDVDENGLLANFTGKGLIYFDENREYRLKPAQDGLFIIDAPAKDVIQFDLKSDKIYALTLNPGPWALKALLKDNISGTDSIKLNLPDDIITRFEDGDVNALIEIPAGTIDKWELDKSTGEIQWELVDDKPRIVNYLGYPCNYGIIPGTLLSKEKGGDGDPLDILVIGPPVERGKIVKCKIIGVLHLMDRGEQDDKLIAVSEDSPLYGVSNLDELDLNYKGIPKILQLWFTNYKGPGKMESKGFGDKNNAIGLLEAAIKEYDK